jgi:cell division protein FtsL
MAVQPEKKIKLLNQIQYNILENSAVKDSRRAKEIARQWLKMAR